MVAITRYQPSQKGRPTSSNLINVFIKTLNFTLLKGHSNFPLLRCNSIRKTEICNRTMYRAERIKAQRTKAIAAGAVRYFEACLNPGLILYGSNEGNCLHAPLVIALVPLKCSSRNFPIQSALYQGDNCLYAPCSISS